MVLVPCFWRSRIHAGDLESHIYNAWLTVRLEQGPVPGLAIVRQSTNVLFDLILAWLLPRVGAVAAQQIAVSGCVLIFFWGSFLFIRKASRSPSWWLVPCIAMLTYGWVFHVGFFNFYLSMGICLMALALAWDCELDGLAVGTLLLTIAWSAHFLPVLWAISVLAGIALARRFRNWFFSVGIAIIVVLRAILGTQLPVYWSWKQIWNITGADQFVIFGWPYALVALAMLVLWLTMLRHRTDQPVVKVMGLLALGILILPASAQFTGQNVALGFVPHRLSLTIALLMCAAIAPAAAVRWQRNLLWGILIAYGVLLYIDTGKLDRQERGLVEALKRQPFGRRMVMAAVKPDARIDMYSHMIDRACIGLCYSYGDYEPSTLAFRLRATSRNPIVVAEYSDSYAMQVGEYVVQDVDLPLYQVNLCPDPIVLPLKTGDIAGKLQCPHP
jgi:hypothetical protein